MCVLACRFLLRLQADRQAAHRWLTVLSFLAFPPVFMSLQMGQFSLWCFVCLLGFVCGLKERRPLDVALWVAAGMLKPQLMVMPCVVLLGLRRWRELGLLATLLLAWGALATAVLGPGCWGAYLTLVLGHGARFGSAGVDPLVMYNAKGLFTALLGSSQGPAINLLTAAVWLGGQAGILWLWRRPGATDAADFPGRMALTVLLAVIVNPHLNPTDAIGLALSAVLFIAYLGRTGAKAEAARLAGLCIFCPLLFLLDCYLVVPARIGFRPFLLLMVVLAVWMAVHLRRRPRSAGSSAVICRWTPPPCVVEYPAPENLPA
jgi:hypothetical protein